MSDASPILVRRQGDVVVLSLNRPERRNAIDRAMVDALHGALDDLEGSAVGPRGPFFGEGKTEGESASECVGRRDLLGIRGRSTSAAVVRAPREA